MLGTTLQDKGCCAEESGISQHSRFSSPADANYSLLNVNWGNISPAQRNSRNGPVVFTVTWEHSSLLPKSCILFTTTTQTGKHREVTKWVWTGKSSTLRVFLLVLAVMWSWGIVEAWGRHYQAGLRVLHVWGATGAVWQHTYAINYTKQTQTSLKGPCPWDHHNAILPHNHSFFSALASFVRFSTLLKSFSFFQDIIKSYHLKAALLVVY